MNFKEECMHCGSSKKPKIIKGVECCRGCEKTWEPIDIDLTYTYDDDSGHDY